MEIVFYHSAAGAEPVRAYLDELPAADAARIAELLTAIRDEGLAAAGVHAKHIEDKIWELKVSRHRLLYVVIGPVLVLVHGYKKQGQKAPVRELEIARRRAREVLNA